MQPQALARGVRPPAGPRAAGGCTYCVEPPHAEQLLDTSHIDFSRFHSTLPHVTIRRAGPTPESEVHTRDLGPVLVTIDDLEALIDFLKERDSNLRQPLEVQFNGGFLDDPQDLRRLSDEELNNLRINAPSIQVLLDRRQAKAIGEEVAAEEVYRVWARARRTRHLPPLSKRERILHGILCLGWGAFGLLFILSGIGNLFLMPTGESVPVGAGAIMVTLGVSALTYSVGRWRYPIGLKPSFALIVPLTLDEYRTNQANNYYPRRAYVVAVVSAAVAVGSIVVAILK